MPDEATPRNLVSDIQLLEEAMNDCFHAVEELRSALIRFNAARGIDQDVSNTSASDLFKHVKMIFRIRK